MSFKMDIEVDGLDKTVDELSDLDLEAAVQRAVLEVAKNILYEAKMRVPVDTGRLKASGDIQVLTSTKAEVKFDAPYAVYVHEDMTMTHPNGEAKFLEKAVRVEVQNVDEIIEKEVKKAIAGLI